MRLWGPPQCPVRPAEQNWIDTSLTWLLAQFGHATLTKPVWLPTDEFFPGDYHGTRDDIRTTTMRLCAHMGVDPARIELEHFGDDHDPGLAALIPLNWQSSGAAGHHRIRDGRSVIGIKDEQAAAPMALVATVAHELGHVLLLADGRITADRADHEPLTDLLTVFFGMGVFAANSAFDFSRDTTSYRTSRLGYMTEPMFGYALARYAWMRGERSPAWATYLDTNPRTFLKRGLRFLDASGR
ncbi:hypothetical protein FB565_000008 [Actinoplanes lutulentus]|uniref:Uncharacterized protein n=1 Tax=Actinoplanes lutulentus TaxID=1287878 RepID=A0A327Z588_9ACTN|nr:hypothetical protein [Actinoplanes lutulentus]MBB2940304.1 hypothetical protein [Actinoplanes lutulentus]RAK28797.1 hypothetical protein B0I29_119135 [Actinoplanes lutulentus]